MLYVLIHLFSGESFRFCWMSEEKRKELNNQLSFEESNYRWELARQPERKKKKSRQRELFNR